MKTKILDSHFRGVGIAIALFSLLFYFAVLFSFSTAAPSAVTCTDNPMIVTDVDDFTEAIHCHTAEAVLSSITISITAEVLLTQTTTISNPNVALTINGNNNHIDGQNISGIQPINVVTGTVTINDARIENGNPAADVNGGGIQNFGTLTLNNVTVISNTTTNNGDGGGIDNGANATLILNDSVVQDNFAADDGGGIQNRLDANLTINNSVIENNFATTFSGGIGTLGPTVISGTTIISNTADSGGGIFNRGASVTIINSSIENNQTSGQGAGIHVDLSGSLDISNSTFSGNFITGNNHGSAINLDDISTSANLENVTLTANDAYSGTISNSGEITLTHTTVVSNTDGTGAAGSFAGLVNIGGGTATLINSILSGNEIGDCLSSSLATIGASGSVNLIETDDAGESCNVTGAITGNANLEELADNGGPTETMLPKTTSPVVDAATSSCLATDQRGVSRGSTCELGAAELVGISIASVGVTEGTGATNVLTFTLTRTDTSVPMTVTVNTTDNTAQAGSDYTALTNQEVGFEAGAATTDFGVSIATDSAVEGNETFTVTLSNAVNGTISVDAAIGTINDDDNATVTLSTAITSTESTASYVFTATLDAAVQGGFEVEVTTADGTATTADNDYTAITGTLTFAGTANEALTVTVPVINNGLTEPDETFIVSLGTITNTLLGGSIATSGSPATGTIANDDAAEFNVLVDSTTVNEADTTIPVTVTLSNEATFTITVDYGTSDDTATAGSDYTSTSGTLTFAPGDLVKTFDVSISDDTSDELDESFVIALSSPSGGTLGANATETISIVDNDGTPSIQLDSTSYVVDENGGTLNVILELSNSSGSIVTATVQTGNITAISGEDFTGFTTTVSIPANTLTQTVSISITDDTLYEGNETFSIGLTAAGNANIGANSAAIVTITEDDSAPTVSISSPTVIEGNTLTSVTFTVTLSAVSGVDATINYATADGTATLADSDYQSANGSLLIPAGQSSGSIIIIVEGDTNSESDETFSVELTSATGATLDSDVENRTGTATIVNDDGASIFLPLIRR